MAGIRAEEVNRPRGGLLQGVPDGCCHESAAVVAFFFAPVVSYNGLLLTVGAVMDSFASPVICGQKLWAGGPPSPTKVTPSPWYSDQQEEGRK